ncbi:hypothetical protein BC829DRAFT_382011 [Chytridium lagenaria]|nr:hypothetical protein BC829DRAFT_382011 [Chytridium lagenaria]
MKRYLCLAAIRFFDALQYQCILFIPTLFSNLVTSKLACVSISCSNCSLNALTLPLLNKPSTTTDHLLP